MNTYKIRYSHGTATIRAWNRLQAQLKFRKKYQVDFIEIRKVR